jgi:PTS system nitrogen regulatory IIA component
MWMQNNDGRILNFKQAAELLSVSQPTLYRWIGDNRIPCYKVEGQWRFFEDELRRWVKEHRKKSKGKKSGRE